jgi:eukaryotic-like serine/threonine-protein kinase
VRAMEVDPSARTEAGAGGGAAADLGPGTSIGKYRLDRVLGTGGMGVVWAAYDPDLERPVAIKVLRSIDSIATLRTRLLREARAMARLKHPNILTVYEVGTDRNRDYIAMELIDGADLDRWLAGKPPRPEVLAALLAAGRGLAAAHDAGLIHRDFKPHNILRGHDGGVYVTDFGLARGQIDDGAELDQTPLAVAATAVASGSHPRAVDSVLDSPLTQTGVLIGTPAYMAPEQFAGRAPDPRSDQFAFCVTAWEALTGARPFAGKTLDELRAAVSAGARSDGGLPPRLDGVLVRGLAPEPAARWPSMRALLEALEAALAPRRRSRAPAWIAAGLGLAAVAGGVAVYAGDNTDAASGASGGECRSASQAFGDAWSNDRRRAVTARHNREVLAIAATAMLDEIRRDWMRLHDAACALPASEARQDRLACLQDVRDDVDETTRELADTGDELSITDIVPLTIAVNACKR